MFSAYQVQLWQALQSSADPDLAAIAAKSLKEARYHLRHAADWAVRLGDGTAESHARMQHAVDALWDYTNELFVADASESELVACGVVVAGATLYPAWNACVVAVLDQATLKTSATQPSSGGFTSQGKLGLHSEHMGFLLAEMQVLARAHPGVQW